MSRISSPPRATAEAGERRTFRMIALVVVASLLFGLLALPRLGPRTPSSGGMAPEFALPVVVGGDPTARVALANYRGQVVVLDFWATWCGPCAEQARILEQFVRVARRDVTILGIDQGETAETVREHFAKRDAGYAILLDADERVGQSYAVRGLPTIVIIDRLGRIAASLSGLVPYARLERLVAEAAEAR